MRQMRLVRMIKREEPEQAMRLPEMPAAVREVNAARAKYG
jgi:hypothetical protein